ncbi:very long chain fatty acid elongase 7-like [Bacillus rossius redtenbacheri]|uniref:very long chain fatty acid elongase 7-like n=1 Tax=Bacillus rossius redtenbacheri TaxID=93214 RepID=UPI002FDC8E71
MMFNISRLQSAYVYVTDDPRDSSVKNLPFLSSPFPMIIVIVSYLYFCNNLGPKIMKNRKALNLRSLLIVYNAFQILASAWLLTQGVLYSWPMRYKFFCQPLEIESSEIGIWASKVLAAYYWLKIVDLLDTIFFVLRKKFSQITFLHLYHHTIMVISSYMVSKYYTGGHLTLVGELNSFVHMVMYTYYLMTSIHSKYSQLIWFKKFITQLQMVQFLILTVQSFPTLFWENCDYPKWLRAISTVQNVFMFCLFGNFYKTAYYKKKTN